MALWGTGYWDTAKWTEQVGQMAATETGVDTFAGEGDVSLAGTMAATESTTDTFASTGTVTVTGQMAATETGTDTFAAEGTVQITGLMSAAESSVDTFAAEGDVNLAGTMSATETGVDVFSAEGDVVQGGTMAATETEVDTFAATGRVDPAPVINPVTADIGPGDEKQRKKAQKKRDESFEKYRQEQLALRKAIEQAIDPVVAKAEPVVVSEGRKQIEVHALDGSKIAVPVPLAFSSEEVARFVAEALESAKVEAMRVKRHQDAQRALEMARVELARIIRRKRNDELMLLLMD